LQSSFNYLLQKLKLKLGVDIQAIFSDIQGGSFSVIRIPLPTFLLSNVPQSYVTFNLEDVAQYSFVPLIRLLCLGMLFLTLIQVILVILRQY